MATRSRDRRKASSPRPRRIPRRSPGSSRRSDICTASSSTPRSPTHRGARTSCATSSGHRRHRALVDGRQLHRDHRGRDPRPRRSACSRHGLRREGHLCTVGRGRLGRRGGFGASGGRRWADLHLCRPWAHAQEGVRAPPPDVRAEPRDAARDGRCAGAVPGASRRGRGSRGEAPDHRRRIHPGVRGRGGRLGRIDFLTQGTLYPDVIESATAETKAAQKIKTHHNVGGCRPTCGSSSIEPLRYLFKDEVRKVGLELGPRRWCCVSRSPDRPRDPDHR